MVYLRGGVFWYKFTFAGRMFRESAKTGSITLARKAERKRHQQLEEAVHGIKKRAAPISLSTAADDWLKLKRPGWAAKTYVIECQNLAHLKPALGSMLLIDLTADNIAEYQENRLTAGAAPKTVNNEVGTLRAILRRHRLWAALQPDVTMLSADPTVGKALTAEEEAQLLEGCRAVASRLLLPIVTLALHTGLRRGELLGLQWQRVDFLNRTLIVGASKTDAGTGRVIPLNERALITLQTWATNFPDREPEDFVFPSEHYGFTGDAWLPHTQTIDPKTPVTDIKKAWLAAKSLAGIVCRFHDLRHTACTRLLERGASLSVAAAIMGWSASTTAMMAKRYGHIGVDAQRTALEALDRPAVETTGTEKSEGSQAGAPPQNS
jgi:integrase